MSSLAKTRPLWVLLAALLLLTLVSFPFDGAVETAVRQHVTPSLRTLAKKISAWGDWPVLAGVGAAALALAVVRRARRLAHILVLMLIGSSVAGIAVNILRVATGRARPDARAEEGWYGLWHDGRWIAGARDFCSFPSAHTTAAIAFFLPLLYPAARRAGLRPVMLVFAVLAPLAVAASRVVQNAHHLSDVLAGLLLGILCALWTARWSFPLRLSRRLMRRSTPA